MISLISKMTKMNLFKFTKIYILLPLLLLSLIVPIRSTASSNNITSLFLGHIRNSVLPSGALAMYGQNPSGGSRKIVPYWSNFAVCGIATEIKFGSGEGREELTNIGWNALSWYKSKQRPNSGIVYDYNSVMGQEISTGQMDSVDSYSATFLSGVNCMLKATGDQSKAREYLPAMKLAIKSIRDLQDKDGLIWTKPDYNVKYLMDNVEVMSGLDSARSVFLQFRDIGGYFSTTNLLQNIELGVNTKMWSEHRKSYKWAIAGDIKNEKTYFTNWNTYYPDALENIWPSAFAVNHVPTRTNHVMNTFASNLENYIDSGLMKGVWNPIVGLGYYNFGNKRLARQSMDYGYQMISNNQGGGIYTVGHAGLFLILYYKLENNSTLSW
jgi:hypothetical protein